MTTAGNVMSEPVISVGPESTLLEVLRTFVEENIHGAPVIDDDERVLGVITSSDLIRAQDPERDAPLAATDYLRGVLEFAPPDWSGELGDFVDRLSGRTAAEHMTKGVVSVQRNAPVAEVARCLRENQIHRVWVEDGERLCGVVSTLDLMPLIEALDGA